MGNQTMAEKELNMHEEMRRAFALLSGKWKLEIMWLLMHVLCACMWMEVDPCRRPHS